MLVAKLFLIKSVHEQFLCRLSGAIFLNFNYLGSAIHAKYVGTLGFDYLPLQNIELQLCQNWAKFRHLLPNLDLYFFVISKLIFSCLLLICDETSTNFSRIVTRSYVLFYL